ncbi:MAG: hypothetical protein DRN04_09195, partial [Thermoprotei archaeon]
TEAVHLQSVKVPNKILIGQTITRGHGTGGNPSLGEAAMRDDVSRIINSIGVPNVVIVTGGLGGGTASGGIPVLLEELRNRFPDALRIALVTFPFAFEGVNRIENARLGLYGILQQADLTIVNLNDLLLKKIGGIPVQFAFKFMDSILVNTLKSLIELITKPSIVSIGYADFVTAVRDMGLGVVGHGVGLKVNVATENAIKNKLLDAELKDAEAALLYVVSSPKTTLEEASEGPRIITERYGIERVFWGLRLDERVEYPKVMFIAAGITSPTIRSLVGEVA